jgi:hypothetical protein
MERIFLIMSTKIEHLGPNKEAYSELRIVSDFLELNGN